MALLHEIEVELFRTRPELARELLRVCAGIDVAGGRIELASADATQAISTEFRADAVALVRDEAGEPSAAIVVEVQRSIDRDKAWSWPVYVTGLRSKQRCPVLLLVTVPDDDVARWAARPIDTGHPGFTLRPIVVRHRDVPRIDDANLASPELLLLSAIAHPSEDVVPALAALIGRSAEETQRVYLTMILAAWPKPLSDRLEAAMRPEFKTRLDELAYEVGHERGREDGLEAGREKGREEGREEGRREGTRVLQDVVLALVIERGASSEVYEARIRAILDPARLKELVLALGRVQSRQHAEQVLAALGD